MVQASSGQIPGLGFGMPCSPRSPGTGQGLGPFPPSPNRANSAPLPARAGSGPSAGPHPPPGLTTALGSSSSCHKTGTRCGFLLRGGTRTELGKMLQASLGAFLDQEHGKQLCTSTGGTCTGKQLWDPLSLICSQGFPEKASELLGGERFPMQEDGLCARALLWTGLTIPKIM